VLVHLVAANLHHIPAEILFVFAQQVIHERVCSREIVIVGHARFVVVTVARTTLRVPLGAFEQDSLGLVAVSLLSAEQPGKSKRRSAVQRLDSIRPVAPPNLAPFFTASHHTFRIGRRLSGRRRPGHNSFTFFDKPVVFVFHLTLRQLSQFAEILRAHKQSRMTFRNSADKLFSNRQRHFRGVIGNRESSCRTPVRTLSVQVLAAITPHICPRFECPGRTMHVKLDTANLILDFLKFRIADALDLPCKAGLRPPAKTRGIDL